MLVWPVLFGVKQMSPNPITVSEVKVMEMLSLWEGAPA